MQKNSFLLPPLPTSLQLLGLGRGMSLPYTWSLFLISSSVIPGQETARRKLPFQPTHSCQEEILVGAKLSQKRGSGRSLPCSFLWLLRFSISCMHMAPVMSSSGVGIGSLSQHNQASVAQVETWEVEGRFLSKGKQGKCWTEFSEQWPLETPQEAAAQLAQPVSSSCAPRNREQHTYGRVGLCHLSHTRANLFTSGKLGVGGFRREVTAHQGSHMPQLPTDSLFLQAFRFFDQWQLLMATI